MPRRELEISITFKRVVFFRAASLALGEERALNLWHWLGWLDVRASGHDGTAA